MLREKRKIGKWLKVSGKGENQNNSLLGCTYSLFDIRLSVLLLITLLFTTPPPVEIFAHCWWSWWLTTDKIEIVMNGTNGLFWPPMKTSSAIVLRAFFSLLGWISYLKNKKKKLDISLHFLLKKFYLDFFLTLEL